MKQRVSLLLMLLLVVLGLPTNSSGVAQGTSAVLSGLVTDSSGAVIDQAVITAQNIRTGVSQQTKSNDSGAYLFSAIQPGIYKITAERDGFRQMVYNDISVEISAKVTLNFELAAGAVTESVEVRASEALLARENTSVGNVLAGTRLHELPLAGRNVLGLVLTQPGLIGSNFAGTRISALNVTRDGINVMDNRINSGVNSTVFNSVDLIEELRVITAPADAEVGRGSGQVQLITRSGTNEFHGSVFEFHRNTVLNAASWFGNLQGNPRDSLVFNQFGGRIGGPIKKNKTFFHFLYEGQTQRERDSVTATVYTQQARQGLFRFFPGVQNGNVNALVPTVDVSGNPVRPAQATGSLQTVNLFTRDPNRPGLDPTGVVQRALDIMPLPNNFRVGDGLNTAGFTWTRVESSDFNNFNIKIDHSFNNQHKLSYSYSREFFDGPNGFLAQPFPASPGGKSHERTSFHSMQLFSTLTPQLQNELRIGAQRPHPRFFAPWELEGGTDLFPRAGDQIYALNFAGVTDPVSIGNDPQGRITPFYQYTDNLSWLRGRHSFKGGIDVRFVSTNGFNSFDVLPRANFGSGGAPLQGINNITGIGQNSGTAGQTLNNLAGSLASVTQAFNSPGGSNPQFIAGEGKQRTWKQREFGFFFKDDFKMKPNLTLNLGVRYEWYGVPYDANGKAVALVGGTAGIFGISGTNASTLFKPGITGGSLTQLEQVGKGSPNPDKQLYNDDWNNFAPAVGLSWGIPWFGQDKTVLRMGYGVSYERTVALRLIDVLAGDQPGLRTLTTFTSPQYMNLTGVNLPLTPFGKPLETIPLTDRTQTIRALDTNLRTPYIQNWSLSIQRALGWKAMLDVRYVGTKGTKLVRGIELNEANIFETGILEAFVTTQLGGNSPLLDRIFNGINIPGLGVVNGTTRTGSDAVRTLSNTAGFLATNNVGAFATFLNSTNQFTGERGGLLKRAGLPPNFIVVNPQFASARLTGNFSNSTYHSFQVDVTKRLSNGLDFQANYTFAKALGDEEGDDQEIINRYRTLRNTKLDKRRLSFDLRHAFRSSWTYQLPFGPGRKLLGGSNRIVSRIVENWQFGGIFNAFSGDPLSLSALLNTVNQFGELDNTPTLVGSIPKDLIKLRVDPSGFVTYFQGLKAVRDPYVSKLTTKGNIQGLSTLMAIADANGNIFLVNPVPGFLGDLGSAIIEGPGTYRFDVNLIKRIRLNETMNLHFEVKAINALNSTIWDNPNTNINSVNFGRITGSGDGRIFALEARFNF